jgi:hypothetical protein
VSYNPIIKVYKPDGVTTETRVGTNGLCDTWVEATCSLAPRGGCLEGTLALEGTILDALAIDEGAIVEYYLDRDNLAGSKLWRGRVANGRVRKADGVLHEYAMSGPYATISGIAPAAGRVTLGTAGTIANTGTVRECVLWILDTYVVPAGEITYSAGDIAACTVAVTELEVTEETNLAELLEQLELMASGADLGHWVSGVDADGGFYFRAIGTTKGPEYILESNLVSASEELGTRKKKSAISLIGTQIASGDQVGRQAKRRYPNPNAAGGEVPTRGRPWRIRAASNRRADLDKIAAGWWARFGGELLALDNLSRDDASGTPVTPWSQQASYQIAGQSLDYRSDIARYEVHLDEAMSASITLGDERSAPGTSYYAPDDVREDAVDYADQPSPLDTMPDVTYDDPPADGWGTIGEETPVDPGLGDGPAVGVVNRQITWFWGPGVGIIGEGLTWLVEINNAGVVTTGSIVHVHLRWYTEAGVATELGYYVCMRILQEGNREVWRTTTPYVPVARGFVAARARVIQPGETEVYYYSPVGGDTPAGADMCWTRVIESAAGGSGGGGTVIVNSGWLGAIG